MSYATDKKMDKPLKYFRLNVDRSFTKKGFGTIVTGTVAHGKAKIGDSLEILPNSIDTKIRGIQTHGRDTQLIIKGDRAAVNLLNVKYASGVVINAKGFGGREPRYYYPGLPRNYFISLNLSI